MGTFCKLLFPPRAKPSPSGWLVSCPRQLQVNVKPFVELSKGREFGRGGRKERQSLDGIFLGLSRIPRIPARARRPSRDLESHWFIAARSSSISFPRQSYIKSVRHSGSLWITPKQTCRAAKETHAAGLRLRCSARAQPHCRPEVLFKHATSEWAIPCSRGSNQSLGSPGGWLKCHEVTGVCGSMFLQKGEFFVHSENVNKYFEFMKPQKTSTH